MDYMCLALWSNDGWDYFVPTSFYHTLIEAEVNEKVFCHSFIRYPIKTTNELLSDIWYCYYRLQTYVCLAEFIAKDSTSNIDVNNCHRIFRLTWYQHLKTYTDDKEL